MSLFRKDDDKNYQVLLAENRFIIDLQVAVERAMADQKLTQAELAKRLNISPARMSQILSDNGANLEARSIARIAHALELVAIIDLVDATAHKKSRAKANAWAEVRIHPPVVKHANDDDCLAAA